MVNTWTGCRLVMYGITFKNLCKKGCLQVMKVLHDSEPNVRKVLLECRTCSSREREYSYYELDMMSERKVPDSKPKPNPNPSPNLLKYKSIMMFLTII
jgi:hypothetical protein